MLTISGDRNLDRVQQGWLFSIPWCLWPQLGRLNEWESPRISLNACSLPYVHLRFNDLNPRAAD